MLSYTVKKLNQLDHWLTKFNYNPNKDNFEDLSAGIDENEVDDQYQKMILWGLRNRHIKNIAVTGPYGSGKTSIIKHFEQTHKQFNFLNISLASFDNALIMDDKERNLVEWSILQQMFYLVKGEAIPDSRFKRIRPTNRPFRIINSILLMIWALSGFHIFFPAFFCRFLGWETFYVHNIQILEYASLIVFLIGICILIVISFRTFKGSKFNKVNFTNAEIGLAPESESSILNKHLDEIIYFFQATKFDTVIIEDLDRFNDPEIFTKLREINNLINNSKEIDRRIVFIYAVKDDIFRDKTRTKFFDFIIPIIPIINYSNSAGKLLEKLKKADITEIGENFINDITLFIDDMRLLKNVLNEYQVYVKKIDKKLDHEKLFALIIYKNIYPEDFAKLHEKKGALHSAFKYKPDYTLNIITDAKTREQILEKEIKQLNKICLKNIEELRLVYISGVIETIPSYSSIFFNGESQSVEMLKSDKGFQELKEANPIRYNLSQGYAPKSTTLTFASIEAKINPEKNYDLREKEIKLRSEKFLDELRIQLKQSRDTQEKIHSWSLKKIILERGAEVIETALKQNHLHELNLLPVQDLSNENPPLTANVLQSTSLHSPTTIEYPSYELLIFMLRNGYIDEMYQSYISHFHPGAVTKEDMDFILSIKVHDRLPFNFELKKIEQLIKLLHLHEFDQVEALNINLLDWVLKRDSQHKEIHSKLFNQLSHSSEISLKFIEKYITEGKNIPEFIKQIATKWAGFWKAIYLSTEYDEEKKISYLKLMLQHLDSKELKSQNIDNILSDYISQKKDFLLLSKDWDVNRVERCIIDLGIYFKSLEVNEEVKELFDFIYRGWYYSLSFEMIETIIKHKNTLILDSSIFEANYTTIQASDCYPLKEYVEDYLPRYINEIFLTLETNVEESENSIITLLNKGIDDGLIESIIKKQKCIIDDIKSVPERAWSILLSEFKLAPKWSNLLHYYRSNGEIDQYLLDYLNKDDIFNDIGFESMKTALHGISEFSEALLLSNGLSDESYEYLSMAFPLKYSEGLDFSLLSPTKVQYLIDREILKLSTANYQMLRNSYHSLHIELLKKHYKEFLKSPDEFVLTSDDWLLLLEDDEFNSKQKLLFIKIINIQNLTIKTSLAETIAFILNNSNKSTEINLLKVLLSSDLTVETKLALLAQNINLLQPDQLISSLVSIGGIYADVTRLGKRPFFESNLLNQKLLRHLDQIKLSTIKSIGPIKGNKIQVFTKLK